MDDARLAACKAYMRVDYTDDDEIISGMMEAADAYVSGAGCDRAAAPAMYDLIVHAMTLQMYDGRAESADSAAMAVPQGVRAVLTQLKLRCGYGGAADGTGG